MPTGVEPILSVRDLRVWFYTDAGVVRAVDGVSFDLHPGETLGIVGESGSGKSVTAKSIIRLLDEPARIAGGSIWFRGKDMVHLTEAAIRDIRGAEIAMVFQDPMTSLNPVRAIGQQMIDIQYREANVSLAEKRRKSADMLRLVGIPDAPRQLGRHSHEFSGGMRQRIAIAMSLLEKPELLIADEPTTALDVTLEAQIIQLLRELRGELNTSILFISHNLGVVAELCDFIVVLYAGEVVERGPVRAIFHRPQHPYTQALLACDPARIDAIQRDLPTIPGDVPNLLRVPKGCVFAPRCPKVFDPCHDRFPPDVAVSEGHVGRCHLLTGGPVG
jgi:peptide/nickel transport system ATP-binding protein